MKTEGKREFPLGEIVGRGYGDFWNFKGRYRVVKGSRGSKKSKTTALNLICRMVEHPGANLLVVRKVYRTLKDSCFTELKWAIGRLGLTDYWDVKESPLEMVYRPTGQKIIFRGLDDGMKITSITVETGVLAFLWIEEAYEIMEEADFDILDESIRGEVPPGLFKQVTLTFNPWNERHWLKRRFFDQPPSPEILAKSVDYRVNEWLDDADKQLFERIKEQNPRRYRVVGLGEWGVIDGLVYDRVEEGAFDPDSEEFLLERPGLRGAFGLDFGYTNDPTALFCGAIDRERGALYVFDELYEKGLTNRMLYERIRAMGYAGERIFADSAEPKSIDELRGLGLSGIRPARKGPDSVMSGIQYIQGLRIIVHPRCVHFLTEIGSYVFEEDPSGRRLNRPAGGMDHLMDAMRYALGEFQRGEAFSFE